MKTLEPTKDDFTILLSALIKARSNAAESGFLDILGPHAGLPGLDPWLADEHTVTLVSELASGKRECDPMLWVNLVRIVDRSAVWSMGLAVMGYEMPSHEDAMNKIITWSTA